MDLVKPVLSNIKYFQDLSPNIDYPASFSKLTGAL